MVNIKIPKKYQQAIKEVYETDNGYMCILNKGYKFGAGYESTCMAQDTIKELKGMFQLIEKGEI